jgi:hypothetical protein
MQYPERQYYGAIISERNLFEIPLLLLDGTSASRAAPPPKVLGWLGERLSHPSAFLLS